MQVAFKLAEPDEAADLSALRHRVWESTYRGIYPDEMIDQFDFALHAKRDRQRIESDRFKVWFVMDGTEKIGYLILEFGSPLHLQSCYLLEKARRKGIGSQCFDFIRAYCMEHSITQFILTCHPDNIGALAFYHKMGGSIITTDIGHVHNEENSVTFMFDVFSE